MKGGIDASRIAVAGMGEANPIADNAPKKVGPRIGGPSSRSSRSRTTNGCRVGLACRVLRTLFAGVQGDACSRSFPSRVFPKTYAGGFQALKNVDLEIRKGEIFALLGPNGAGKTTLIGITCGIVNPTAGRVTADGHDIIRDFRAARSKIGLVPQELSTDAFETVWATVNFSRGLFGKAPNRPYIEKVLRDLSLWDKKDAKIMTLSGGMKRRVMIAKALSHEPQILFLDEPTAGVDVELRRDMWEMVRRLREAASRSS